MLSRRCVVTENIYRAMKSLRERNLQGKTRYAAWNFARKFRATRARIGFGWEPKLHDVMGLKDTMMRWELIYACSEPFLGWARWLLVKRLFQGPPKRCRNLVSNQNAVGGSRDDGAVRDICRSNVKKRYWRDYIYFQLLLCRNCSWSKLIKTTAHVTKKHEVLCDDQIWKGGEKRGEVWWPRKPYEASSWFTITWFLYL